ncbi:MBOAT, membrane-bound O-acyltransferase family-domain-containing protein [Favolaschia claudopus]|uniref:MBOAT, membrane-bound O-acyltransferase family-domain-containing protein n=1 Tax=Favolaschia claudopus TaxID=2862362 RepID=A0AAW0EAS8_9AGAR
MTVIPLIRLAALWYAAVVVAFSVIVLGLSAALTSTTEKYLNGYFEFAALAIATSVITLITVPIMIVMEFLHHGAMFTSMVLFELSWLSILWVLWLATAADTTQANAFISGCDYISDVVNTACRETQAVQAFSFLNWLILMAYTILILVLSIIAHSRQHTGVWRSSVAEAPFFTPGAGPAIPPTTSQPETAQPASYGPSTVSAGGYETQHTAHHLNTSEGGTGPAIAFFGFPTFASGDPNFSLQSTMDALFVPLAGAAGASVDQVKLITCLLVAYPLGSLFIRIPSDQPTLKHLFNIGITLLYFFPVLSLYSAFFQLLASVLATYIIAKYYHGSNMPWLVFAVVMGHLTFNHVIRSIFQFSYETLEVTGPQMVLTMKLTTFAWNVYDGRRPAEDLDKWQTAKRITQFPTLLEFLGYSFYFPGILVGPYLDFNDYMDLINETLFKKLKAKGKNGRNVPSGRKRVAYRKMFSGLAYLGIFVYAYKDCDIPILWCNGAYEILRCLDSHRGTVGPLSSLILTGLGFTGLSLSGGTTWDGAANVNPLMIELAPNFKVLLDSWNMKTNVWLRECVYKRVTPKGKKPGFRSSMITFATSAFWHGIAGGYYLTFVTGGFITTIARLARANIRPLLLPAPGASPSLAKRVYDILGTILTVTLLNFAAAPFMILGVKDSITAWGRLGFYGHIIIGGSMAFFYAGGTKGLRGMQARQATRIVKVNSTMTTPVNEKQFMVPPSFDQIVPPQK